MDYRKIQKLISQAALILKILSVRRFIICKQKLIHVRIFSLSQTAKRRSLNESVAESVPSLKGMRANIHQMFKITKTELLRETGACHGMKTVIKMDC